MDFKSRPLFLTLGLLWSRMGPMRFYVLGATGVVVVLAVLGVVHLISAATRGPASREDVAVSHDAQIAITEIGSTETKNRNGQLNVAVKIGVVPRPNPKKGEVEIRVSFFDVTPAGEMRPTEAQVNYEWLTPVRDWTDPTPKYLVATYLGSGTSRRSAEKLRYGGFLVRVYLDGKLQAERSQPKELVAALRSGATPSASPAAAVESRTQISVATPGPIASRPPSPSERKPAENVVANNPVAPSPSPLKTTGGNSSAVPYASPVPDKPGFVYSPHDRKFLIDVRGFPPGTEVIDPNTSKPFKVP